MTRRGRRILVGVLGIVLLAAVVLAVNLMYPRCENCGRRYGPLLPHLYRHPTTRQSGQHGTLRRTGKSPAGKARAAATASVINELPPLTDTNRQLPLWREVLVGVWESQAGTRNPLYFHTDGSVQVGFIKKDGKWVMPPGSSRSSRVAWSPGSLITEPVWRCLFVSREEFSRRPADRVHRLSGARRAQCRNLRELTARPAASGRVL